MPSFLPRFFVRGIATLSLVVSCSPRSTTGDQAAPPPESDRAALPPSSLPGTTWPDDAATPFSLRAPGTPLALAVRLASALPVPGRWDDLDLRFDDPLGPGTSLTLRPRPDGLEDHVAFARPPAGEQADYALDVRAVAGLRQVGRVVEFLDDRGTPRLRMEAPTIIGADGRVAQADVELGCAHDESTAPPWGRAVVGPGADECRLTVRWSGRGVSYPAVLDPAWTTTANPADARDGGTAGTLPDGRALVTSGRQCVGTVCTDLLTTELFDVETGTWAQGAALHSGHTSAQLIEITSEGFVLIGGDGSLTQPTSVKATEFYSFTSNTWESWAPMPTGRYQYAAALSPKSKKISVFGGLNSPKVNAELSVDVLDLATKTWSTPGATGGPRAFHSATYLDGDRVLLAGGAPSSQVKVPLATTELYDLTTNTTKPLGPMPVARVTHSAHRLQIGGKDKVLVVGGATFACDLFDVETLTWSSAPALKRLRALNAAVALSDGSILVAGGLGISLTGQSTAERLDPATLEWTLTQPMHESRSSMASTRLKGDRVLVAGGTSTFFSTTSSFETAEVFAPIETGQPCTVAGDCLSLQCADGVCCESACKGTCEACSVAKTGAPSGTCAAIAKDADPDSECPSEEAGSCGRIGTCDGQRHCALYAKGTLCGEASCASDVGTVQLCSGTGSCVPQVAKCTPFRCKDPTSCATDCDSDDQCAAEGYCENKTCHADVKQGEACTRGAQCPSGQCVDGVCCDTACANCQACKQSLKADGSADGTCGAAREGIDPHDFCAESSVSTCDQNGQCDGKGACALYKDGTECEPGTCVSNASGGLDTVRRECNGQGSCLPTSHDCGLFACVKGDCAPDCKTDDDCLKTAYCEQGQCLARKPAGDFTCSGNQECKDGFCVDGFCCNQACQGQCEACNVDGAHGTCFPVTGAPHGARDVCPGGTDDQPCQARTCDGSLRSSCRGFAGDDVVCRPATCADGVETRAASCDGAGRCEESTTVHCEPFVCQGNVCAASCTSSDDCAPQFRCDLAATTSTGTHDCVPRTVAECDDDGLTLLKTDGSREPCAPYTCRAGACQQACASVLDCVLPNVCDDKTHVCLPARPNPDDSGCTVSHRGAGPSRAGAAWVVLAAALGLARRRRARLGSLASVALGLLGGCSSGATATPGNTGGAPAGPAAGDLPTTRAVRRSPAVRTTLPRLASDAVRLETDAAAVGFRLAGALAAPATTLPTGADFAGALGPGTTMHLRHTDHGVEDSVTFDRPPAREQVDYALDVRAVAGLRQMGRVVEFLDDRGTPRLRMEPPYITGADGRVAQADVELGCAHDESPLAPWGRAVVGPGADECRLTVRWSGRGVAYPAVLDPAWTTTMSMPGDGRRDHVYGQLTNGTVLMAGGIACSAGDCDISLGAEYFDPETGSWSPAKPMTQLQFKSGFVTIPGVGLMAASSDVGSSVGQGNAQLFNEKTGLWEQLDPLTVPRFGPTATLVLDGTAVAVIGGTATKKATTAVAAIELFDLKTRKWSPGGDLSVGKIYHSATLLPGGKVLVAGGIPCGDCALDSVTAELYDPVARTSTPLPVMPGPHGGHVAAIVLVGGKPMVVLTGGSSTRSDLFDPATSTWVAGPTMNAIRTFASGAVLLNNRGFLAVGGIELPLTQNVTAELFDPASMQWLPAGQTSGPLISGSAVTLDDGRVLIAGGILDYAKGTQTTPRAQFFRMLDQGQACSGPGECLSGSCADGVCCESACQGTCEACSVAKTGAPSGTCAAIAKDADPDSECLDEGVGSCGRVGTCDGQRHCSLYAPKTPCGPTLCLNGVVNRASCDGGGKCVPSGELCGLFVCKDGSSCATSCQDDKPCAIEAHCDGGTCVLDVKQGEACTRGAQCPSGQCVDGVCCDTACLDRCQACAQALKADGSPDGTCGPVSAGLDPHDSCLEAPTESCDFDGTCDGKGECARYAKGTKCQDTVCVSSTLATRSESHACDGDGNCKTDATDCKAFGCADGVCLTSCQTDADCLTGTRCQGGTCVAQARQGTPCTQPSDCLSGECADGVCCNGPCGGSCESCAEEGNKGSCIPVFGAPRAGHGTCAGATDGDPCTARTCDGSVSRAACEGYAGSAVPCHAASCADGVASLRASCDGQGHCPAPETVRCEPFVCQGDVCAKSCASDSDCGDKFRCDLLKTTGTGTGTHACVPRTGAFCNADGHTLTSADGTPSECAPYACEGAACRHDCSSVLDCVLPSVCNGETKKCVAPVENTSDAACALASSGRTPPAGAPLAVGLLAAAALAGRRRRSVA